MPTFTQNTDQERDVVIQEVYLRYTTVFCALTSSVGATSSMGWNEWRVIKTTNGKCTMPTNVLMKTKPVPGYLPPTSLDSDQGSHQRLIHKGVGDAGKYSSYLKYNCAVVNYHYNWPTNPPENPAFTLPGAPDCNDSSVPYHANPNTGQIDSCDLKNPGGTGADDIIALYNQGTPKALPASLGFRSENKWWGTGGAA